MIESKWSVKFNQKFKMYLIFFKFLKFKFKVNIYRNIFKKSQFEPP